MTSDDGQSFQAIMVGKICWAILSVLCKALGSRLLKMKGQFQSNQI